MKRFAVIENNTVTNIAICDAALGPDWIEVNGDVNKGDVYDPMANTFTPAHSTDPGRTIITKLAFSERFPDAVLIAIEEAKASDAELRVITNKQRDATYIDLSDARTAASLALLVAKNLMTQEEADAVLHAPVSDAELFTFNQ